MWSRQLRRFLKGNSRTFYSLLVLLLVVLLFFFLIGYLTSSSYLVTEELYKEIKVVSERPHHEHLKIPAIIDEQKPIENVDRSRVDDRSRKMQFNADRLRDLRSRKDVPIDRNQMTKFKNVKINGEPYPRLTIDGKFVPIRRWVHLDLKGAPFREAYFMKLFPFIKSLNANGVVIEWEDMFPYTGKLASARNGNAYSMDAVRRILKAAKESGLEAVPLVQTIGHLEWVLKLQEFSHLRDDVKFPQVICVGSAEAWSLLSEMIEQVAKVHAEFGMNYFHMGADEVFQIGVCQETMKVMEREGNHNRLLLWHLVRVAAFVKNKYPVTVLAWHDMLERVSEEDLINYNAVNLLEPVLWSYAEDLEQYLSPFTWSALKPFKRIWGGSVYKGADGPLRYSSNPIHYIRNQESWITQFTRVYPEFELVQGLILSGWSRYDHLAALCETFPVGVPSLAMGVETVLAGRPLDGNYPISNDVLKCQAPYTPGYAFGCDFPGHRVYELINEFNAQHEMLSKYRTTDYEFNGWLSALTEKFPVSSPMYIQKIMPFIDYYLLPMEKLAEELRAEMSKIFFNDTYDEFHLTYMAEDLQFLRTRKRVATDLLAQKYFAKRPFVKGT